MFEFIRLQYIMSKITSEQVYRFVPKYITKEEADAIVNEGNS